MLMNIQRSTFNAQRPRHPSTPVHGEPRRSRVGFVIAGPSSPQPSPPLRGLNASLFVWRLVIGVIGFCGFCRLASRLHLGDTEPKQRIEGQRFMLNGYEIVLIMALALIFFSAKKLPELAR